jgi:hypothetical protein
MFHDIPLHENAGKSPDIFIIRCARAGHGSYFA